MQKFDNIYEAYKFLEYHPLLNNSILRYHLDISVVRVNPKNGEIEANEKLNTKTMIWLQFGFPEIRNGEETNTIDFDLEVEEETFEKAIISLANKVAEKYVNGERPEEIPLEI